MYLLYKGNMGICICVLHVYLLCVCVSACASTRTLSSARLLAARWTVGHRAFLPMGFSRQEYWSGWPFPSTEDLSDPGIEPACPVSPGDVSRRILYHSAAWLSLKTNYQTTSTFKETFYCWGIGEVS